MLTLKINKSKMVETGSKHLWKEKQKFFFRLTNCYQKQEEIEVLYVAEKEEWWRKPCGHIGESCCPSRFFIKAVNIISSHI